LQGMTAHLAFCIYKVVNFYLFLGTFAKLRKATLSIVMSVHLEQLGSHSTDFREI